MKSLMRIVSCLVLGLVNYAWGMEPPLPRFEAQTVDAAVAIGYGVAIGDVDGDGKPDILVADKRQIVWYRNPDWKKFVMAADLTLGLGSDQVVVGWRNRNAQKKVGIRLYLPPDAPGSAWKSHVIDDNTMACEDLKVADLDGDGRPDIIGSGRNSHNLVIYWNKTESIVYRLELCPCTGEMYQYADVELVETAGP